MIWKLGFARKRLGLSVIPDEDSAGRAWHKKSLRRGDLEWSGSDASRLRAERLVMIALAGPVAQQLYAPRSWRAWHGRSDFEEASHVVLAHSGSSDEASLYLKLLRKRTEQCLRNPAARVAVRELANILAKRKTLSGDEAQKIIMDSMAKPGQRRAR